jgi:hypothetical protein
MITIKWLFNYFKYRLLRHIRSKAALDTSLGQCVYVLVGTSMYHIQVIFQWDSKKKFFLEYNPKFYTFC